MTLCLLVASNMLICSRPLHYQWDLVDPTAQGSCVNFHAFFVGKGIANVCLNAVIFILVSSKHLALLLFVC